MWFDFLDCCPASAPTKPIVQQGDTHKADKERWEMDMVAPPVPAPMSSRSARALWPAVPSPEPRYEGGRERSKGGREIRVSRVAEGPRSFSICHAREGGGGEEETRNVFFDFNAREFPLDYTRDTKTRTTREKS